jgi:hypothetical protein
VVALTCCRLAARPRARQLWLCAEGPATRHEAERIRLRLRWEQSANQDHRWDEARHLWDVGCQMPDLDAAWAIDDRDRADRSSELMETGRLREGLATYGIELSPQLDEVVRGDVPWYELRHLAGTWSAAVHGHLSGAAPWLLALAARRVAPAKPPLRLFGLGGQNIARKPGVYLTCHPSTPRLEIHWSATNVRLPLTRQAPNPM